VTSLATGCFAPAERVGAQALVEEPTEEQHCADREEREGTSDRAEGREVEEEDLANVIPNSTKPAIANPREGQRQNAAAAAAPAPEAG
jgi:predicted transcriptional regulator